MYKYDASLRVYLFICLVSIVISMRKPLLSSTVLLLVPYTILLSFCGTQLVNPCFAACSQNVFPNHAALNAVSIFLTIGMQILLYVIILYSSIRGSAFLHLSVII